MNTAEKVYQDVKSFSGTFSAWREVAFPANLEVFLHIGGALSCGSYLTTRYVRAHGTRGN